MAITKFGEFMRILRIKKKILMKDTADSLGVKTPFLSAVENGKKKIPDNWFGKICEIYSLSNFECEELKMAIEESVTQVKIDLIDCNDYKRNLAFQFQRSFPDLNEETSKRIISLLKGDD